MYAQPSCRSINFNSTPSKTVEGRAKAREDAKTTAAASTPVNVTLSSTALEILKASYAKDQATNEESKDKAPSTAVADQAAADASAGAKPTGGLLDLFKGFGKQRKAATA